jgi:hypothetical protein
LGNPKGDEMKEYICKEVQTDNGGYLEIKTELIRCDDCKANGWCVLSHTELTGEGYCAWAKPKDNRE